jgi:hypothetical protein
MLTLEVFSEELHEYTGELAVTVASRVTVSQQLLTVSTPEARLSAGALTAVTTTVPVVSQPFLLATTEYVPALLTVTD